jgi:hypothetical protein
MMPLPTLKDFATPTNPLPATAGNTRHHQASLRLP